MQRAYIGLGSNLENPVRQLDLAINALKAVDSILVLSVSAYYSNPAMLAADDTSPQPDYINAVVSIETSLSAQALLAVLLAIEDRQGRVRCGRQWAPRVIDLDLLLYADAIIDEPDLKVPHPGLPQRAFVLYPLHEIAPDLIIPGQGRLLDLLEQIDIEILQKVRLG